VPRSGENARRRLQGAALELWSERGYDTTTAAEIAARAGVTERTFFRHFPDKREVLFDGAAAMRATLIGVLAETPAALTPLEALRWAFSAVEPLFEENRPYSGIRQRIIAETPALQERESAKVALLTAALAEALQRRGVEGRLATLAAQTGMAAFGHAVASWIEFPTEGLDAHLDRAFEQLHALSSTNRRADPNGNQPPMRDASRDRSCG
jgi:AcrR family transcriptional regulator